MSVVRLSPLAPILEMPLVREDARVDAPHMIFRMLMHILFMLWMIVQLSGCAALCEIGGVWSYRAGKCVPAK